jgi:hypothetical protein
MKIAEAITLLESGPSRPAGYRVQWEWRERGLLRSDMTPDREEEPFKTEKEAWEFAVKLATVIGDRICNVFVIDAKTFAPVPNYESKTLLRYPPREGL